MKKKTLKSVPMPNIQVRVPVEVYDYLNKQANKERRPLSNFVRLVLEDLVKKNAKSQAA